MEERDVLDMMIDRAIAAGALIVIVLIVIIGALVMGVAGALD